MLFESKKRQSSLMTAKRGKVKPSRVPMDRPEKGVSVSDWTVMAPGSINSQGSVSAILTNVTHKEAAWSSGATKGRQRPGTILSRGGGTRRAPKGGCVLPCQRGSTRKLICVHTPASLRRAASGPCNTGDTSPSAIHGIHPSEPHHTFIYASLYSSAGRHCLLHRVTGNMCCLLSRPEIATTDHSMT